MAKKKKEDTVQTTDLGDVSNDAAQAILDVGTTADQSAPAVQEFMTKGKAAGLTEQEIEGGIAAAGWGFGATEDRSPRRVPGTARG